MNSWPSSTALGELVSQRKQFVRIDDTLTYKRCRVQLHAGGIVLRDRLPGVDIKTKKQQVCRSGDFLVAEIDAKVGGFGVVPDDLDGAIVSSHYFLFEIDEQRLNRQFLNYFIRTAGFQEQVKAQGSTNYAAIRSQDVLRYRIPLPPLEEQRRIVARIEEIAEKVEDAMILRDESVEQTDALLLSTLHNYFVSEASGWNEMPMDEAIEITDRQVDPRFPEYSLLPHISGENVEGKTCRLLPWRSALADDVKSSNYLFSPRTILYSKIRPYLRKAAYVDFTGLCSADMYPIRVKSELLDTQFVKWSLVAEPFTEYANRLSGRTRMPKLNRKQLFAFRLRYPPIGMQREIVRRIEALNLRSSKVKAIQEDRGAQLDALLPSVLDKAFKGEL